MNQEILSKNIALQRDIGIVKEELQKAAKQNAEVDSSVDTKKLVSELKMLKEKNRKMWEIKYEELQFVQEVNFTIVAIAH